MATIAAGTASADFSVGRVISRTFSVVGRNFVTFFVLALFTQVPLALSRWYNAETIPAGFTPQEIAARSLSGPVMVVGLSGFAIYLVLAFVLQAAIVRGAVASLNGQKASLSQCISAGLRVFFPILGIVFLETLGFALGLLLLIIPGIMLIIRWNVAVPVRVMEGPGILKSMGRSAELTRGHRWAIFGVLVVFGLISIGLSIVLVTFNAATMGALSAQNTSVVGLVLSALIGAIAIMLGGATAASIYYELRTIKEGIGPEQLAAVFS
jgi:hypothetical protein